jgi:hypothetical protein
MLGKLSDERLTGMPSAELAPAPVPPVTSGRTPAAEHVALHGQPPRELAGVGE